MQIEQHPVVSREAWIAARKAHLEREKALTRARDELARERRALPWVRVEKEYVFEGPNGRQTLADLFAGRSQLVVDHFMLGPGWSEGCVGCSFGADHVDGGLVHLEHHDVSVVAVSRAPIAEIEAFRKRMGWKFPWVSSFGSDFNYDYWVSFTEEDEKRNQAFYNFATGPFMNDEMPGLSVFYRAENGDIFHTYSSYARGCETTLTTYSILDMTPKGRNEGPGGNLTEWVRMHDRYDAEKGESSCCA